MHFQQNSERAIAGIFFENTSIVDNGFQYQTRTIVVKPRCFVNSFFKKGLIWLYNMKTGM